MIISIIITNDYWNDYLLTVATTKFTFDNYWNDYYNNDYLLTVANKECRINK